MYRSSRCLLPNCPLNVCPARSCDRLLNASHLAAQPGPPHLGLHLLSTRSPTSVGMNTHQTGSELGELTSQAQERLVAFEQCPTWAWAIPTMPCPVAQLKRLVSSAIHPFLLYIFGSALCWPSLARFWKVPVGAPAPCYLTALVLEVD